MNFLMGSYKKYQVWRLAARKFKKDTWEEGIIELRLFSY